MTGRSSLIIGAVLTGALVISLSGCAHAADTAASPTTATGDTSIRPFKVQVPQAALDDLRRRIAATRWPDKESTWGGEIRSEFTPQPAEVVALEHWCSSGFANTDLDLQLKRHGVMR